MVRVPDTVGFVVGRWSVERRITDRYAAGSGVFEGEAAVVLRPTSEAGGARVADYHERGRMSLARYHGDAERRLRYVGLRTGGALITFADGRPFVDCDLQSGAWSSRHRCGEDVYDIHFEVVSDSELTEVWRVSGPAKSYRARTRARRLPAGDAAI